MKKALSEATINWKHLSTNERELLWYLHVQEAPQTLAGMQDAVFGDLGTGTSMTRNTLRRLRSCRVVYRTRPGAYKITAHGSRIIEIAQENPNKAAKRFLRSRMGIAA